MTQRKYFPDTTPPRGLPLRLEVKEKDQNTGTPEPYYGKTLFQGFAVFDGHDFIPFGSFHRLPIFWDGRLNAFGHKDVTAKRIDAVRSSRWKPSRYAPRRVERVGRVAPLRPWRKSTTLSASCLTASGR